LITFQKELLADVVAEVQPLLEQHYQELCLHKDKIRLNPRWDQYAALELMGAFMVLTARDDGKLAGYAAFFLNTNMHYADLSMAVNDVLFLAPEYRNRPRVGMRLIEYSEREARAAGARKIIFHAKLNTPIVTLLNGKGYVTEELMLGKFLQGD